MWGFDSEDRCRSERDPFLCQVSKKTHLQAKARSLVPRSYHLLRRRELQTTVFCPVVFQAGGLYCLEMIVENYTLKVETQPTCDIVDITDDVQKHVDRSGIKNGVVTLFVVGSTGGLTTVEYEPGLVQDLSDLFEKLAPSNRDYHHEKMWHDGNGYSHVRASLLKPDLSVPVVGGEMTLGTWQQIVLINFDNRSRSRRVTVQITGA